MPLHSKKVISIIIDECNVAENRCDGYRVELAETLSDIITLEKKHRIQGTNIQQKINDKCSALGRYLLERRGTET